MNILDIHTLRQKFVEKLLNVVTLLTLDINNAHYDMGYLNSLVLDALLEDVYLFKIITADEYTTFYQNQQKLQKAFQRNDYLLMKEAHEEFISLVEKFGTTYSDSIKDKIHHIVSSV